MAGLPGCAVSAASSGGREGFRVRRSPDPIITIMITITITIISSSSSIIIIVSSSSSSSVMRGRWGIKINSFIHSLRI